MSAATSEPSTSCEGTANCSQSLTTVSTYSATHFWTIKNFNSLQHKRGEYLASTSFHACGNGDDPNADDTLREVKFNLVLYPRGRKNEEEFAGVYLEVELNKDATGQEQYVDTTYSISIGREKHGTELFNDVEKTRRFTNDDTWGFDKCFARPVSESLNREFTITCTLTYSGNPETMGMSPDVATVMTRRDKNDLDMISLYNEGLLTDVDILVGNSIDKHVIKAHKFVLALKSPVFKKIFTSAFTESSSNEVNIPDISADIFELLMLHMYGEEIPRDLDMKRVEELLYGSEKYELSGLKAECQNLLSAMIKTDTVVRLLSMSDKYNAEILKRSCHKFLKSNWKELTEMPGWDWGSIMLHHAQVLEQTTVTNTRPNDDHCSGPGPATRRQKRKYK